MTPPKFFAEISSKVQEFGLLGTMVTLAALLVLVEWRKRPLWMPAGILIGVVTGLVLDQLGVAPGWQWLWVAIMAYLAPALFIWWDGKSPPEILREILEAWDAVRRRK